MKLLRDLIDLPTAAALAGLASVTLGLALVYVPLALIVPGAAVFGLSVWPRMRTPSQPRQR